MIDRCTFRVSLIVLVPIIARSPLFSNTLRSQRILSKFFAFTCFCNSLILSLLSRPFSLPVRVACFFPRRLLSPCLLLHLILMKTVIIFIAPFCLSVSFISINPQQLNSQVWSRVSETPHVNLCWELGNTRQSLSQAYSNFQTSH